MSFLKNLALFAFWFALSFAIPTSISVLAKVSTEPAKSDLEQIIKFENKEYKIIPDKSVSLQPTSQMRIKKIGYGKESYINIIGTSSGVYSSSSLISPIVKYKGIIVSEIKDRQPKNAKVWILDKDWVATPILPANSIVTFLPEQI